MSTALRMQAEAIKAGLQDEGCKVERFDNVLRVRRKGVHDGTLAETCLYLEVQWSKHGELIAGVCGTSAVFPILSDYGLGIPETCKAVAVALDPKDPANVIRHTNPALSLGIPGPTLTTYYTVEDRCNWCSDPIFFAWQVVNGVLVEGDGASFYENKVELNKECNNCANESMYVIRIWSRNEQREEKQ